SGDKPIVVLLVQENDQLGIVRQLLSAHTYWRLKGLEVDLVILNEHPTGYFEELHVQLQNLVRSSDAHALIDKPGGIFVRKAATIPEEDKVLLQAAARVVLSGGQGSLSPQIDRLDRSPPLPPRLKTTRGRGDTDTQRDGDAAQRRGSESTRTDLLFANGLGGF